MTSKDTAGFHSLAPAQPNQMLWVTVDALLLVLILMLSADLIVQIPTAQSALWLVCYALTLLRIAVVWPAFLNVIARNWIILLYPAICLASVLWSVDKKYSLVTGIQLSMTIVMAMYLGWRYSITVLLKVLAVVLSIGVGLSILHWATGIFPWPVYTRVGGLAGLFSSKNMLGLRALFAVSAILSILMMTRAQAGPTFKGLALVALVANIFALGLSLSITSVLLVPMTVAILLMLSWRNVPPTLLVVGIFTALALLCVGPVALVIAGINPVEAVLGAVGKSSTLTGRVDLWEIAAGIYRDNPVLGVGYRAFWQSAQFVNERLATEEAGAVTSRSFHNFVLEILVSGGAGALVAMFMLIWTATTRMIRLHRLTSSVAMAGGLSLLAGAVVSSLVGTTLYRGHEIMIILLVTFAVSAGEDLFQMHQRRETPTKDDQ